ncbi:MAG TPA: HD domain-containing protein [Gemmatimonadales bacterium]|jgi:HD superfamily phosphohydrolase YqeK
MSGTPSAPGLRPTLPAWAIVSIERLAHIERVAELVSSWAEHMGIPANERNRWLRAVWLHDALRDAPAEELEKWASTSLGPPSLRHGPASAARAKAEGEIDRGVLDAVRYHSLGLAEWDMVGRSLYCGDYLEPGRSRDRERRAELAVRFPSDPGGVLREVARERVTRLVQSGWTLPEPTVRFWNSLVASHSASR